MVPRDDDAEQREEDAREAARSRLRQIALEAAREDRALLWDRFNINIRDDAGIEKAERRINGLHTIGIDLDSKEGRERAFAVVAWCYRAQERSALMFKRLMAWLAALGVVIGALSALIDVYMKVRGMK